MTNPFMTQYKNSFTSINKPIINNQNGSPLLGNGKINSLNIKSLRPMGVSAPAAPAPVPAPAPTSTTTALQPIRPLNMVRQPQPPLGMVKENLRIIFNENYYKTLFEYSAPAVSPLAPIGGSTPIIHHHVHIRSPKPPKMPGERAVKMNMNPNINHTPTHGLDHKTSMGDNRPNWK